MYVASILYKDKIRSRSTYVHMYACTCLSASTYIRSYIHAFIRKYTNIVYIKFHAHKYFNAYCYPYVHMYVPSITHICTFIPNFTYLCRTAIVCSICLLNSSLSLLPAICFVCFVFFRVNTYLSSHSTLQEMQMTVRTYIP